MIIATRAMASWKIFSVEASSTGAVSVSFAISSIAHRGQMSCLVSYLYPALIETGGGYSLMDAKCMLDVHLVGCMGLRR